MNADERGETKMQVTCFQSALIGVDRRLSAARQISVFFSSLLG